MEILCITPNVSVDRLLTVPGFTAGGVWRAARVRAVCGGKGVNVARAVRRLGHGAVCAGLLAGHAGRYAAEAAAAEGLEGRWTWIDGESRTCVIVVGDAASTVVNEPGQEVSAADWRRFGEDARAAAATADAVCLSGSLPPGCPSGGVGDLIRSLRRPDRPVWVDTSGAALAEALSAAPDGIKINSDEAAVHFGRPLRSPDDAAAAVRSLCGAGIGTAVITLGGDGAVLATADGTWRSRPPAVDVVNATGAGDCFLAALVIALAERRSPMEALRFATAVGSADALRVTVAVFEAEDVSQIVASTDAARLA